MALHFKPAEFEARTAKVIAALAEQGLDGLLMFQQESMYYLTGYDSFGFCFFQCLYLGCDGRLALLTRAALRDATFARIFGARTYPYNGSAWTNANRLLYSYEPLIGGKVDLGAPQLRANGQQRCIEPVNDLRRNHSEAPQRVIESLSALRVADQRDLVGPRVVVGHQGETRPRWGLEYAATVGTQIVATRRPLDPGPPTSGLNGSRRPSAG